jgi:stage II sporulation protein GA (sporulation sigma-E factor processing peptidase)
LSYDRFKQWTGEQDFIRYVPFSSLGAKDGFLPVTDVEELIIYNGKRAECIRHAAIGAADRGLLEPKEYDLILHASLGKQI